MNEQYEFNLVKIGIHHLHNNLRFMCVHCLVQVTSLIRRWFILVSVIIYSISYTYGQLDLSVHFRKLYSNYLSAGNDSSRIESLSAISYYYFDILGDKLKADSVGMKAIEVAQSSFRPELLVQAYNKYLESNDLGLNFNKALKFANEAVKLSKLLGDEKQTWRSFSNLTEVYLAVYQYDKALGFSYQGFAIADETENRELKVLSYLQIGRSLEGSNQKIEAFRNYLNATEIAGKIKDPALMIRCYSELSRFYNFNKLFAQAISYKLKQVALINSVRPVDSLAYLWSQYDLQTINMNSNNNSLSQASVNQILDFALRHQYKRLKDYEIALYRSYLVEANKMNQLYDFYLRQYPGELNKLSLDNPALYYRLKAIFCEKQLQPDSALYYYTKAEGLLGNESNKILLSKFFFRFGQFLEREKLYREAILKYQKSFNLAREASYLEYMVNASGSLEKMYHSMADFKEAYTYSNMNHTLSDSLDHLAENDELLKLEIEHEGKQREVREKEVHEATIRNHNIQYTAITVVILTLFIVLIMLGSLKVPEWSIRMLGFFSFILFFEFIIMIADHKIYEITANEPWKILLIKIGLIAFLLPFHHWIEKQVIHYLINHKLIDFSRISPLKMIRMRFRKTQSD
jgi:hypothetical protein